MATAKYGVNEMMAKVERKYESMEHLLVVKGMLLDSETGFSRSEIVNFYLCGMKSHQQYQMDLRSIQSLLERDSEAEWKAMCEMDCVDENDAEERKNWINAKAVRLAEIHWVNVHGTQFVK